MKKNCGNKIPKPSELLDEDYQLINNLKKNVKNLINLMNNQDLNEYIKTVVNFSFSTNKYFNDLEPWAVKKKDPERMKTILFTVSEQIKNLSILLNPIIPNATNKVLDTMNIDINTRKLDIIDNLNSFDHSKNLKDLEILFNKIDNVN